MGSQNSFPFLKEKRKWGRKTQADEYPQGAGRICNAPSSRTAALGIGPYKDSRKIHGIATPVRALVRNDASVLFFWAAYAAALSRIFERPVKETLLYFFDCDAAVHP